MVRVDAHQLDVRLGYQLREERQQRGIPRARLPHPGKREADGELETGADEAQEALGGGVVAGGGDFAEVALVHALVEDAALDVRDAGATRDRLRGQLEPPRLMHHRVDHDLSRHITHPWTEEIAPQRSQRGH